MHLPSSITQFLIESEPLLVVKPEITNISGGCINDCYSVKYGYAKYFLKVNSSAAFPGMFEAESKGLRLLAETKTFPVPVPLLQVSDGKYQYLLMPFFQQGVTENYSAAAGNLLAALHTKTADSFGLDHDNYIGSLKQKNTYYSSFTDFFVNCRIEPMLKLAIDKKAADKSVCKYFDSFYCKLDEIIPKEKPSLLHGDLWSGNMMSSVHGPAIFDPAVYYGHREADIAMTKLFGGFENDFYAAYMSSFPLEKGWEQRIDVFNLYPLLVHVVLFGGGYYSEVKEIIQKF